MGYMIKYTDLQPITIVARAASCYGGLEFLKPPLPCLTTRRMQAPQVQLQVATL